MKHNFLAWRHLDPAPVDQKGSLAILEEIKNLGKQHLEQIEGVKTAHQKALDDAKKDLSEGVTEAKVAAQKATDAVEEVKQQMASVKAFKIAEPEVKSLGERIKEAVEEKHDDIQKFAKKETKKLILELKAVGDFSAANVTGTTNWGAQSRADIIMNQNRMTHIRSLLPVGQAGPGTDYYFMRENGAGEGSIAATSEKTAAAAATTQATGLKPQFDLDLVESSVKFETVAGWMPMSRRAMLNIPGLMNFLQRRIPEKLLNAEDAYVLYGTGTSPQIKGILASGNFVAGSAAGATPLAEKIINDISLFEDTYERIANGIALRPADYWSFFKNKASGSGEYDLPQGFVFVNGVLYAMGIPVAKTTALTAGDYVVGDFQNGAELLIQEGMRLEFFEQDGTNVRTNQITARIEETIALPVFGPDYFIKGSSATS